MGSENVVPPPVYWAQTKELVYLTFSVECKEPIIKIEKDSVYFKGINAPDKKVNEVTIQLYDAISPDTSTHVNKGRNVEMVLTKEKKDASFWPNLTKDKKKPHYLKIDFNKWCDEDDDKDEDGNFKSGQKIGDHNFEEMLKSIGGNYGPKGDKATFDDLESDSDDDNLPDLE